MQVGVDCEILLDGMGYFIKPGSYRVEQPRVRKTAVRSDGGLSYVDLGPGKRVWYMVVLCLNDLLCYDGSPTGISGQEYRDTLLTSYRASVGLTLPFVDPSNATSVAVHFDAYSELPLDLHLQQIALSLGSPPSLSYEVSITLIEA